MIPFGYQKAATVNDAIAAAAGGGRYLAGGTTLVDLMREEVEQPDRLVDINKLPLDYIREQDNALVIGALARMSDVAEHEATLRLHPVIAETLIQGASPQLRNMASIGGNLLQRVRCPYFRMLDAPCNKRQPGSGCYAIDGINAGHAILGASDQCVATHPSDLAVSLVALDAVMTVAGPQGTRTFPVEELFRLPGNTPHIEHSLNPGELITEVRIPNGALSRKARYLKVRDRASYEFALVSAMAAVVMDSDIMTEVRIAVGGVGTKPWRMRAVEAALVGKPANRGSFEEAARLSLDGVRPLSHNGFKAALLPRTIVRALELAGEMS